MKTVLKLLSAYVNVKMAAEIHSQWWFRVFSFIFSLTEERTEYHTNSEYLLQRVSFVLIANRERCDEFS